MKTISIILFTIFNLIILIFVLIILYRFRDPLPNIQRFRRADSLNESDPKYWFEQAENKLAEQLNRPQNTNRAKNVIFFLGDGMSMTTITAARIYRGQLLGIPGAESTQLSFDKFPFVGLTKTYCLDRQVPDSACTATAYLCGVRNNYATIGVTGNVKFNDCPGSNRTENQLKSMAIWAQDAGYLTGFVTTTRVTHATPAGLYSHVPNREYECDTDIKEYKQSPADCQDIASQLINNRPGIDFKVILGGGRVKFLPNGTVDEDGLSGERSDGVNLIKKWKGNKPGNQYISDREGLLNLTNFSTKVLGLFAPNHMNYNLDRNKTKEPSLAEMTAAAIILLSAADKRTGKSPPYFLFVEGGRIDTAHHDTKARKALDETVQFSEAIQRAVDLTDHSETLIIVTSDHGHTMTMSGYPERGRDILGLALRSDVDHLPFTTLSYASGQDQKLNSNGTRQDLSSTNLKNKNFQYPSMVPMKLENHGGADVAIYARGPWSHLFSGSLDQNDIPCFIGYAACIGQGSTCCSDKRC